MMNQCLGMYQELLTAIRLQSQYSKSHRQWIEDCFQLCFRACNQLQQIKEKYCFLDLQEQTSFYKDIEPQFAAQIKYFTLLYAVDVFAPEDDEKRMTYWFNEQRKC